MNNEKLNYALLTLGILLLAGFIGGLMYTEYNLELARMQSPAKCRCLP